MEKIDIKEIETWSPVKYDTIKEVAEKINEIIDKLNA